MGGPVQTFHTHPTMNLGGPAGDQVCNLQPQKFIGFKTNTNKKKQKSSKSDHCLFNKNI